jgi:type IV pilus assembly protein PilA
VTWGVSHPRFIPSIEELRGLPNQNQSSPRAWRAKEIGRARVQKLLAIPRNVVAARGLLYCLADSPNQVHDYQERQLKLQAKRAFTLIELMIVIAIIAIIAAIAIPNLIEARKSGNESAAIGSLKAITSAQSLYREGDKDADGTLQYATHIELGAAANGSLIDPILASGTKQGYNFAAASIAASPLYQWSAIGNPVSASTGQRKFYVNHTGVIYYTSGATAAALGVAEPSGYIALGQ